ncbi:MAG TPA: TolB family protein [Bacteroidota bacterium]
MTRMTWKTLASMTSLPLILAGMAMSQSSGIGQFENHGDIGRTHTAGSVKYDDGKGEYLVGGSGENMWFASDAFQFVWKKWSGDVSLAADVRWIGTTGNPHRKACLLIRQSLDPDAPYVDAALHGDGLTSLQYREVRGGPTREIQSGVAGPRKIRIEREGNEVFMSVAPEGGELRAAGGSFRIALRDPYFVGLGVCVHDSNAFEQAVFSNVVLGRPRATGGERVLESTLETIAIASTDRRAIYTTRDHIEAPNWSRDGEYFLFNGKGLIFRLPVKGGTPRALDLGFANRCNNDHGLSPDGTMLAISDQSADGKSLIYTLPAGGGTPVRVTPSGPSYWHGWSPDGATLAYCAERNGEFDIYTIPASGGTERRLTTAPGLDDGPDYSPDGRYIYFNSERTGKMQVWRMKPDGTDQQQMTSDEYNNWFPHPSPDGKWVVFLSYANDVHGHPENKDVMLRLMPAEGGEIRVLAKLFGGQGTINVPSWSPNSAMVAFVSYRLAAP